MTKHRLTNHSSILEIGLSIFAASMTALRPLFKKINCLSGFGSSGQSREAGSKDLSAPRVATDPNRIRGPSYRLDDMHTSDADSEEAIIMPRALEDKKQSDVNVTDENDRSQGRVKVPWNQQHPHGG